VKIDYGQNHGNGKLILFGGYFCSDDLEFEENFHDCWCLDQTLMKWK